MLCCVFGGTVQFYSWFKDNISMWISMAAVDQARITNSPLEDDLVIL